MRSTYFWNLFFFILFIALRSHFYFRSLSSIHATVTVVAGTDCPTELVSRNRGRSLNGLFHSLAGITLASVRRKPNALNLLHQLYMLERMNKKSNDFKVRVELLPECSLRVAQEWDQASQIASAYQIGKSESQAALNLYKNCSQEVVEQLTVMVKKLVPECCVV